MYPELVVVRCTNTSMCYAIRLLRTNYAVLRIVQIAAIIHWSGLIALLNTVIIVYDYFNKRKTTASKTSNSSFRDNPQLCLYVFPCY